MAEFTIAGGLDGKEEIPIIQATLDECKHYADTLVMTVTSTELDRDAYAVAWTTYKNGKDVDKAEAYSGKHRMSTMLVGLLTKRLSMVRAYISYLESGGEMNNPFWSD